MRSCPYVMLAPVLDAQDAKIRSLEEQLSGAARTSDRQLAEQRRTNERLMVRLDALERSARNVTPESARRPPREASDLVFEKTRNDVKLAMGDKMAYCDAGFGCAISSETLQSGTHLWEIQLTRTDGEVGIGVCTERHGFCLDLEGKAWCRGVMARAKWVTDTNNVVAGAEAPWYDNVEVGSSLVVKFDCGTGRLCVGPKNLESASVSHVFGELASTPVAPFVFLTGGNTCDIAPYSPSRKRERSRSPSSSRSPSPFIRRSGLGRTHTERRSRLDDVSFADEDRYQRFDSGLRGAPGRGVGRWSRPPPPPSPSSSSDESSEAPPPPPRRGRVARGGR